MTDGIDYRLWEPAGEDWPMARQVVFEREGTRVQIMSSTLEPEALIAFDATSRRRPWIHRLPQPEAAGV